MKFRKIVCALVTGVLLVSVAGCGLISKTPEAIAKTPVAKVNGEVITKAEYQKQLNQTIASINAQYGANYDQTTEGKAMVEQYKTSIIQNMETSLLLLQKAKELKLDTDTKKIDTDVAAQVADIKKTSFSDDETKFQAGIKQAGYTLETLKVDVRKQVIIQYVLDYINKSVTAVTDVEVQDYYNTNKATITESPNTIHYSQIVLNTQADADKVITRLNNKEDFATVAKEVSVDTTTKDKGGDMGDVEYTSTTVDATVLASAKKLKDGEVSTPISSNGSFYIVKVASRKEYPIKAFDTVKADIKASLLSQKQSDAQNKQIQTWTTAAKIETITKEL
jgi:foldase protein PrsA